MKTSILMSLVAFGLSFHVSAFAHKMQHGFILSDDDTFASHLVANGHHSRQVEIIGQLSVPDAKEMEFYRQRKDLSAINQTYFLFQAQQQDLPSVVAGDVFSGHIIESKTGDYEPKNVVVKAATFRVQKVLLNIANPFFAEEMKSFRLNRRGNPAGGSNHCCDTGAKPCNYKC